MIIPFSLISTSIKVTLTLKTMVYVYWRIYKYFFFFTYFSLDLVMNNIMYRLHLSQGVVRLSTPGGQESNISSIFLILLDFLSSFLNISPFSSSIWGSGWADRPPGKALATPLQIFHMKKKTKTKTKTERTNKQTRVEFDLAFCPFCSLHDSPKGKTSL